MAIVWVYMHVKWCVKYQSIAYILKIEKINNL